MDALALLCTLHADGPATLKRLRAAGCPDLAALLDRSADDVAELLDADAPVARRLLREAKILRARVGDEVLDREEAPSTVAAAEPALPPSIPMEPVPDVKVELDAADRALVSKIRAHAPVAAPVEVEREPQVEAAVEPFAEPEPVVEIAPAPPVAEAPAAPVETEPTPKIEDAPANVLPEGFDPELVQDLADLGITTMPQLAAAETLSLTRSLGVTFAQARRLRFLARRAGQVAIQGEPLEAQEVVTEPGTPTEPETVVDPVVVQEESPRSEVEPIVEPQPQPEPEPEPEPAPSVAEAPAEDLETAADDDVVIPRRPFWEPRTFLDQSPDAEEQGVPVDPSEIASRPRFGDRFAATLVPAEEPAASEAEDGAEAPSHTVLGWNFEIPRPGVESLPDAPAPTHATPARGTDDRPSPATDAAGPFA